MPTEAFTGAELDDSRLLLELLMTLVKNDDCDDALEDALLLAAAEPLQRTLQQDIGPERLSIARLQREAAARGQDVDEVRIFFVCARRYTPPSQCIGLEGSMQLVGSGSLCSIGCCWRR